MSLIALGSVITSPYQAIPTAYRLCCVGIGDSDVQGLGLSSLSATDFHSYLVGRRFRMGPGKWRGWSRTLLAGQAGVFGPVGDRYVRLDIARSIESYFPQCGPATYSYSSPRSECWSSMGKTRRFTGLASPLATLTYSRSRWRPCMIRASITPGMARTRLNRSSESM